LDYKEFSAVFFGNTTQKSEVSHQYKPNQQQQAPQYDAAQLVKLFRDKIKSRGARGIIGLSKLFKIMDDDGSKSIS